MRNLAAKVPEGLWPNFKAPAQAAYQVPSRAIAHDLAEGVVTNYRAMLPSALACVLDDFEACIAHLRLPIGLRAATLVRRKGRAETDVRKLDQEYEADIGLNAEPSKDAAGGRIPAKP